MNFLSTTKGVWWRLREEWTTGWMRFLLSIPMGTGAIMRRLFLPYFLGGLGKNTTFQAGIRITTPKKLSVGSNCNIAQCVFITAAGGVRIGDWVGIGRDAK